jgi:hypothetical protein
MNRDLAALARRAQSLVESADGLEDELTRFLESYSKDLERLEKAKTFDSERAEIIGRAVRALQSAHAQASEATEILNGLSEGLSEFIEEFQ